MSHSLPAHLKRYVVEQDYSRYTPMDQAVWRYIMRQLTTYLGTHAHPCYLEGLAKTGIEIDRIPEISHMSEMLEKFGWRAVPVSGFIPPAAFMELQAHGFLPIACDLRTIDHLEYTPAPDIVHEAAGHAPILVDHAFASYLKSYAQVASKAIISSEDLEQYEAIRILSDLKEDPGTSAEAISQAEKNLDQVTKSISHISEAALLGRMNWWTAEYGLIGDLKSPKIFGAGLLSSVGEARECLSPKVKKIPLTINCINYAYDITEPQPQLFVTPDFAHLKVVLDQFAERMAFRVGGVKGLELAKIARTVNTAQLNSGLQISGVLKEIFQDAAAPTYLQFQGPTQLCLNGSEIPKHGKVIHAQGFGTPVGLLEGVAKCLSTFTDTDLQNKGWKKDSLCELQFCSGVKVRGKLSSLTRDPKTNALVIMSFYDCVVSLGAKTLFEPAWGMFDMAVGSQVTSVFGGPADRVSFGQTEDFVAKRVVKQTQTPMMSALNELYEKVDTVRRNLKGKSVDSSEALSSLEEISRRLKNDFPDDWLLRLELSELAQSLGATHLS